MAAHHLVLLLSRYSMVESQARQHLIYHLPPVLLHNASRPIQPMMIPIRRITVHHCCSNKRRVIFKIQRGRFSPDVLKRGPEGCRNVKKLPPVAEQFWDFLYDFLTSSGLLATSPDC